MKKLSLVLLALAFVGCGSGGGSGAGGGSDANGNKPGQATDCPTAWQMMVKASPQGLTKVYREVSSSMGSAASTTTEKEVVVESNDTQIVRQTTRNPGGTHTSTITKVDFLNMCQNAGGNTGGTQGNSQVLDSHPEQITVTAGTFNCTYVKTKTTIDQNGMTVEVTSEVWTTNENGLDLTVKMNSTQVMKMGPQTVTTTSSRELVQVKY